MKDLGVCTHTWRRIVYICQVILPFSAVISLARPVLKRNTLFQAICKKTVTTMVANEENGHFQMTLFRNPQRWAAWWVFQSSPNIWIPGQEHIRPAMQLTLQRFGSRATSRSESRRFWCGFVFKKLSRSTHFQNQLAKQGHMLNPKLEQREQFIASTISHQLILPKTIVAANVFDPSARVIFHLPRISWTIAVWQENHFPDIISASLCRENSSDLLEHWTEDPCRLPASHSAFYVNFCSC